MLRMTIGLPCCKGNNPQNPGAFYCPGNHPLMFCARSGAARPEDFPLGREKALEELAVAPIRVAMLTAKEAVTFLNHGV